MWSSGGSYCTLMRSTALWVLPLSYHPHHFPDFFLAKLPLDLPLESLHPSLFIAVLWMHLSCCIFKVFALTLPLFWNVLPPDIGSDLYSWFCSNVTLSERPLLTNHLTKQPNPPPLNSLFPFLSYILHSWCIINLFVFHMSLHVRM